MKGFSEGLQHHTAQLPDPIQLCADVAGSTYVVKNNENILKRTLAFSDKKAFVPMDE